MAAITQPDSPEIQKRRSDRVIIRIPLSIVGTDQDGHDFGGRAVTEMVSRFGASIVTNLSLFPEQELTLIPTGKKRILARVIGQTSIGPDGHVYGIAFLNRTIESWGIHFPPLAETVAAAHVECGSCHAQEIVSLNQLEFEVFRANDRLRRLCPQCGNFTIWRVPEETTTRRSPQKSPLPAAGGEQPGPELRCETPGAAEAATAERPQPQRMYSRVRANMKACIAQPGSADDIVNTINISRGGVLVRSAREYPTESWVQVAVPYTPSAANIFVPARVVWRGEVEGTHQYGLKYVKG